MRLLSSATNNLPRVLEFVTVNCQIKYFEKKKKKKGYTILFDSVIHVTILKLLKVMATRYLIDS